MYVGCLDLLNRIVMQHPYIFNIFLHKLHPIVEAMCIFNCTDETNIASTGWVIGFDDPNVGESILEVPVYLFQTFFMVQN